MSGTVGNTFLVGSVGADGTNVSHQDAAGAIMVEVGEPLPPHQRGAFSGLESHRLRLAGVTKPVS